MPEPAITTTAQDRQHLLVFGDSTAFHGPEQAHPPTDPRLSQQVAARLLAERLGGEVEVDLVARPGTLTRNAWWSLTRDPVVWGTFLPRADALVISVGHMDQLPSPMPTWMRESIPYVRPGGLRRQIRHAYQRTAPAIIRATSGRLPQLSVPASQHYLTRMVTAVRHWRPDMPIVRVLPVPFDSPDYYPSARHHAAAVAAARAWCANHGVIPVDLEQIVGDGFAQQRNNPDGLHWGWQTHEEVGRVLADALGVALAHHEPGRASKAASSGVQAPLGQMDNGTMP